MAKEVTKLTQEQKQLVEDNHQLIYGFLTKYKLPEDEWYDLCAIGLVNAALDYNKEKGAFSTLAYTYMFNEMRNEFIHRDRYFPENLSIDENYGDDDDPTTLLDMYGSECNVEKDVVSKIYIDEMRKFFNENLTQDSHKKVIELIFEGKGKDEAAKEVGISRERIDQAIDKIYLKCVKELSLHHINHGKRRKKIIEKGYYKKGKKYD